MPLREGAIGTDFKACRWLNLHEALHHFSTSSEKQQSQRHIKPLHWYIASRLVIEGGFRPEEITPRPPFRVEEKGSRYLLHFDSDVAGGGERTILGGLKTKNVDVVVTKDGLGPVLAVSCKGMTGALRNLTNRMEETIGECTNLHITYPALVFGYMFVVKANRQEADAAARLPSDGAPPERALQANDIAIAEGGEPVESVVRFHSALRELTGRKGIRNDVSRYEAVAFLMSEPGGARAGELLEVFPKSDSPLHFKRFFETLYLRYEERFLFGAPDLKSVTGRLEWDPGSPALGSDLSLGIRPDIEYQARVAEEGYRAPRSF